MSLAQNALAQADTSGRVGITAKRDTVSDRKLDSLPHRLVPAPPRAAQKDTTCPCWKYIGAGALIGTTVGAGLGFTTAFVITHGRHSGYIDHSEDGLAYMIFSVLGGVTGFVVGIVAGSLHR